MKTKPTHIASSIHLALFAILLLNLICWQRVTAQGTTFTYQGRLNDAAGAANGTYDLRFALYDAASAGAQQGNLLTNSATAVTNGLFTVSLNFGNQFPGAARWLEIGVRTNGGGAFTTLAPRQPLTPTPYAITASNAFTSASATSFSGALAGDVTGPQGSTVVANVGGLTAGNVASGANAANGAATTATANTIVKRDASGNINGNIITGASLVGDGQNVINLKPISILAGTAGISITGSAATATTATNLAGNGTVNSTNFVGNGAGLTNLSLAALPVGLAFLNSNQVFTASNRFNGAVTATNLSNVFAGDGSGLTNLSPAKISSGTAAINISGNAASATTANTFSGALAGDVTGTQAATVVSSVGSQTAANLAAGAVAANAATNAPVPNTIVKRDATGGFAAGTITATNFAGNGANLTNLNASQLTSGTVPLALLPGAVVTNGETGVSISGNFTGNGGGLTNVNAVLLGGLAPAIFWQLDGNNVNPGDFLGSTNNQAVEFRVNGQRALLITTNISDAPNLVGGSPVNVVDANVRGAVIAGGGTTNFLGGASTNRVSADFSSVSGGSGNEIQPGADHSVISGGWANLISTNAYESVVAGGQNNTVEGGSPYAFIGGGNQNTVAGGSAYGFIGGGTKNTLRWLFDTEVPTFNNTIGGGYLNTIEGAVYAGAILGGRFNTIQSYSVCSFLGGGESNTNKGPFNFLGGGQANNLGNGGSLVIVGGNGNSIGALNIGSCGGSFIGGGSYNSIVLGLFGAIVGGYRNSNGGEASFIGGGHTNLIQTNADNSFLGGGAANKIFANTDYAVIGGGLANSIQGFSPNSFIGGGQNNAILDASDIILGNNVICGGYSNIIAFDLAWTAIVGGFQNSIRSNAFYAFVGGGVSNIAAGRYSTVPGGSQNSAGGDSSFAAGQQAKANHAGAFVWADPQNVDFTSTGTNQFLIRAKGGVGINTNLTLEGGLTINANTYLLDHPIYLRGRDGTVDHNHGLAYSGTSVTNFGTGNVQVDGPVLWGYTGGALAVRNGGDHAVLVWTNGGAYVNGGFAYGSDRNIKAGFNKLDAQEILARVTSLPVTSWFYKTDAGARHVGPMAQDFHAAFQLGGDDDKHINIGDATGVALAAIQGLNEKLEAQRTENAQLKVQLAELKSQMQKLLTGK